MTTGGDVVSSSAAMPAGIAPVVTRSLWCFLWSFLCGDSIVDRSWRAAQRGLERPRYKHTTLLYSLAVKVFEFSGATSVVCSGRHRAASGSSSTPSSSAPPTCLAIAVALGAGQGVLVQVGTKTASHGRAVSETAEQGGKINLDLFLNLQLTNSQASPVGLAHSL